MTGLAGGLASGAWKADAEPETSVPATSKAILMVQKVDRRNENKNMIFRRGLCR
jgi:hypothetical protein